MTDAQWAVLEPLVPANQPGGRPPKHSRRELLDAIIYVVRQGCAWRAMPTEFPPWATTYWYFQEWQAQGVWDRIEDALRRKLRLKLGRKENPTAGVLDSQTVRGSEQPGPRGFDGGKKTTGIKRHVCVDTEGLVWGLRVSAANESDSIGARLAVLDALDACDSRMRLMGADSAYQGFCYFAALLLNLVVRIVRRRKGQKGFKVQKRRWVVERTFGWLTRWRRCNRNYEHTLGSARAIVQVALIGIMTRRRAKLK
jgi:transposase